MTAKHWILELRVFGRTMRFARRRWSITRGSDTLAIRPGLRGDDIQVAAGDRAVVEVVDRELDWADLAQGIEEQRASLLLWEEGTDYDTAEVLVRGRARGFAYDRPGAPVSLEVVDDLGADALQIPDQLALVSEETWDPAKIPEDQEGAYYPVIMGYPGYVAGRATPYPVVPVPLAEFTAGGGSASYFVVGDRVLEGFDPSAPSEAIRIDNVADGSTGDLAARTQEDDRGRVVTYTTAGALNPAASSDKKQFYAGFSASTSDGYGVGGSFRGAYDVIRWLLQTWAGPSDVDWARLPESGWLNRYKVDDWINAPTDPWEYLGKLIRNMPVTLRTSQRGRYLSRDRYRAVAQDAVGSLDEGTGDWQARSAVAWEAVDLANEITVEYRRNRNGTWLGRRILGAESGRLGRSYSATDERVTSNVLCRRSQGSYGVRQASPVQLDWTWDDDTALFVGQDIADERALPRQSVTAFVPHRTGADLRTGQVWLLTHSDLSLSDRVAIVAEPPVVGALGVTARFRLPI